VNNSAGQNGSVVPRAMVSQLSGSDVGVVSGERLSWRICPLHEMFVVNIGEVSNDVIFGDEFGEKSSTPNSLVGCLTPRFKHGSSYETCSLCVVCRIEHAYCF
jgi:hypothetical protein